MYILFSDDRKNVYEKKNRYLEELSSFITRIEVREGTGRGHRTFLMQFLAIDVQYY